MKHHHNITPMKHLFLLFTLTLVLSCDTAVKESQSLTDLKAKKTALIEQMDRIGTELKDVEMAISELDTLKKLMTVTSYKAEVKDFNHYIEVQGTVKADQTIELHAEMGGTVTAILTKEGQNVSKGQILATLDSDVIDNSVLQLNTQLALATTTFERQARLWEQNIGSEIQYLQAKAQKDGLENSMKSLRAQARKMKVIAPFSGIIDQIFAKTGEMTSPQMPFLRLVNLSNVYVESEITETYLKSIKKDTEVLLYFSSIGTSVEASISQVGNFINPNNRSFKTRIDLKNPNNELKANLLADIKINDFKANGIVIPSRLVQKDRNDKTFVYTIEPQENNHSVVKTYVTEAMSYDNLSFISEGLSENSMLVDKGARLVNNNEDVKLVH
ncbi:RND transporter [Formosa sp. Hel1_33_131]|jgi:RND family efflux transporter MFP subunit|uniref:efflux RND transporter periplasmic adaptor subunit n=1 Tax=Formosa sp. Hel1_33_131 TaxID=1336794 RepID=UPI000865B4FE|nr:efflux RND transporter periplasmic adaptor subunit [Formosa sp. Hel1_33_131]AOR28510.1 RND transporter [Formosa sp. Hel1_33_131]